jgi:hypothetical protein
VLTGTNAPKRLTATNSRMIAANYVKGATRLVAQAGIITHEFDWSSSGMQIFTYARMFCVTYSAHFDLATLQPCLASKPPAKPTVSCLSIPAYIYANRYVH